METIKFIEQFCYIKDKKTNVRKPIKLSKLQKKFINHLDRLKNKQLEVLGSNDSKRQLREFKIKCKVVLAYNKKDAIKMVNHLYNSITWN